jgi:hypothetical protein
MKIFPSDKFEIETGMTKEDAIKHLKNVTDKEKFRNWYWSTKPYMGEVDEKGFRIVETLAAKTEFIITVNGFYCDIYGTLRESESGTIILVETRLNRGAKIFMSIWLTIVAIIFAGSLASLFLGNIKSFYFLLVSIGFFFFGFLMMTFSFRMDKRGVTARLIKIFKRQKGAGD